MTSFRFTPEMMMSFRETINIANALTGTKEARDANLSKRAIESVGGIQRDDVVREARELYDERCKNDMCRNVDQYDSVAMEERFFKDLYDDPASLQLLNDCCYTGDCPKMNYQQCLVDVIERTSGENKNDQHKQ